MMHGNLRLAGTGIVVAAMVLSAGELANLCPNPDFEEAMGDDKPQGWTLAGDGSWSNQGRNGSRCLELEKKKERQAEWTSDLISWNGDPFADVACWIRTAEMTGGDSTGNAILMLEGYDANNQAVAGQEIGGASGTNGWQHLRKIIPIPANVRLVRLVFHFNLVDTGKAWLDDVVLCPARENAAKDKIPSGSGSVKTGQLGNGSSQNEEGNNIKHKPEEKQ